MVAQAPTTPLPTLSRPDKLRLTLYFSLGQSVEALAHELQNIHRGHQARLKTSNPPATFHEALTTENTALSGLLPSSSALSTQPSAPPDSYELAAWTLHESIAPHIAYRRAESLERRRQSALQELDTILTSSDSPIEKRRAATTMLRMLTTQLHRSRAASPSSHSGEGALRGGAGSAPPTNSPSRYTPPTSPITNSSNSSTPDSHPCSSVPSVADSSPHLGSSGPSVASSSDSVTASLSHCVTSIPAAYSAGEIQTPPNTPLPDPSRSPEQLIQITLAAIQNPDSPSPDAGHIILYNLHGNSRRRSFAEFNHFNNNYLNSICAAWRFRSAAGAAPLKPTPTGLTTRIPLTLSDDTTCNLEINLRQPAAGTLKDCWLIDYVILHSNRPNSS